MLIGYARVSRDDQNTNLQMDALKMAGCDRIEEDHITGAHTDRPGLKAILDYARAGDVIVVWRLDRFGRSLKDLVDMISKLESRGIGLKSLQEAIDTTSSTGRLILHIFAALAEFERNLIADRCKAGLAAARARGRIGGRPKALDKDKRALAIKLYKERQHTVKKLCQMLSIAKPTLYKYLREENAM
jgi:DNA invertase Pin-like site-specific DNA recombinase